MTKSIKGMSIERQEYEVNKLEQIDGKLVDVGKVKSQHVTIRACYSCEESEYLDHLIDDMETTLDKLRLLRCERELDKRLEKRL